MSIFTFVPVEISNSLVIMSTNSLDKLRQAINQLLHEDTFQFRPFEGHSDVLCVYYVVHPDTVEDPTPVVSENTLLGYVIESS